MNIKRTGWNWYKRSGFDEIVPQDDTKEHLLGDECWCKPQTRLDPKYQPQIVHNSADKRELNEPDHWQERYL